MAQPCVDCPFNESGPGYFLRTTLGKARWQSITDEMKEGDQHFICHKTSKETGNGTSLICAGSITYQAKHGVTSNLLRVMERITKVMR